MSLTIIKCETSAEKEWLEQIYKMLLTFRQRIRVRKNKESKRKGIQL